MVSFNCDGCGDVVKKPKLDQHYQRCHAPVTCLDCSKQFGHPAEWKSHTSCVSEAEKYERSVYRGGQKKAKNDGKQERKQIAAAKQADNHVSSKAANISKPSSEASDGKKRKQDADADEKRKSKKKNKTNGEGNLMFQDGSQGSHVDTEPVTEEGDGKKAKGAGKDIASTDARSVKEGSDDVKNLKTKAKKEKDEKRAGGEKRDKKEKKESKNKENKEEMGHKTVEKDETSKASEKNTEDVKAKKDKKDKSEKKDKKRKSNGDVGIKTADKKAKLEKKAKKQKSA